MAQKEHIVEAASKMFAGYGIKAVRMDDIAHELGVSKRTLYELFGDKEELLYEALIHLFSEKRKEHMLIASKAENLLEAMFLVLNKMMEEAPVHNRLTSNLKKFYPKVFERIKSVGIEENNRSLLKHIEEGISEGYFVDWMDSELTIAIFCGVARSLKGGNEQLNIEAQVSEREAFIQVITTLFRGIATEKGRKLMDSYAERYRKML